MYLHAYALHTLFSPGKYNFLQRTTATRRHRTQAASLVWSDTTTEAASLSLIVISRAYHQHLQGFRFPSPVGGWDWRYPTYRCYWRYFGGWYISKYLKASLASGGLSIVRYVSSDQLCINILSYLLIYYLPYR